MPLFAQLALAAPQLASHFYSSSLWPLRPVSGEEQYLESHICLCLLATTSE